MEKMRRKARPIVDDDDDDDDTTTVYGAPLADPGGDQTPINTEQDEKMILEDLKTAVVKFNRHDQAIYAAQLEALKNPKNRRKALADRIPEFTSTTDDAMELARENVINGLEMIDILEQINILDTMIGDLGGLERQVQNRISKLIHKGCNIEALTGNPMKPPGTFRWEYGPLFPGDSTDLFSTQCSEMAFLHEVMMRVVRLSDKAETEGTTWGNKLKKFNKQVNFEDPSAGDVFSSLGELLEDLDIQADEEELRERRRRRKKEKKNFNRRKK